MKLSTKLSLEKIVDSVLDLPETSQELTEFINSLEIMFPRKYDNYSISEPYRLGNLSLEYNKEKVADLSVKFPEYKVYPFFTHAVSLHTDDEKLINLERKLHKFIVLSQELLSDYRSFEGLKKPDDFLSKKDYLKAFTDTFDYFQRFNKMYGELRENHCVYGNDLGFVIKFDLDELVKPLYGYHDYLNEKIVDIKSLNSDSKNVSLALRRLNSEKKKLEKVIKKYETLKVKEKGLVSLLKKGFDLFKYEPKISKKILKNVGKFMYKVMA